MKAIHRLGAVVSLVGTACSTSAPDNITCGDGTRLEGSVCVSTDAIAETHEAAAPADTQDEAVIATDTRADSLDSTTEDTTAADSLTDSPVDALTDSPTSADDPCPSTLDINCSDSCPKKSCAYTCENTASGIFLKVPVGAAPFVMRTPSKPMPDLACIDGTCKHRYAFVFDYSWPRIRVRVGSGWRIGAATGPRGLCVRPGSTTSCYFTDFGYRPIIVYTDDPDAPARNIVIDNPPLDGGVPCP